MELLWIALGAALLWLSGEAVLRGLVDLGRMARLSDTVIGVCLIGLANALPSYVLFSLAIARGQADLAGGAILLAASCLVTGVLGLCAVLRPVHSARPAALRGAGVVILVALVALGLCVAQAGMQRGFGLLALLLMAFGMVWLARGRGGDQIGLDHAWRAPLGIEKASRTALSLILFFIALGGLGLYFGANLVLGGVKDVLGTSPEAARAPAIGLIAGALALPNAFAAFLQAAGKPGLHLGIIIARIAYSVLGGFALAALLGAPGLTALWPMALALALLALAAGALWTYGAGLSRRDGLLLAAACCGYLLWFGISA